LGKREDACVCIRYTEVKELAMWRGLGIADETLEATVDGSD
jgi:hypothetical protein